MNFPVERSSAGVRFWRQDQRGRDGRPARTVWGGSVGAGLTRKRRAGLSSAGLGKRRRIHFSLPRLRSLPPSMLSGYFPASRALPGSPGSSSLTSVPLLLGSLLLE